MAERERQRINVIWHDMYAHMNKNTEQWTCVHVHECSYPIPVSQSLPCILNIEQTKFRNCLRSATYEASHPKSNTENETETKQKNKKQKQNV